MRSPVLRPCLAALLCLALLAPVGASAQTSDAEDMIARVKPSIVAIGTFERTRSPQFQFRGTGFALGDGTLVATNDHVLPTSVDTSRNERIVILIPAGSLDAGPPEVREARPVARDSARDIALVKIDGRPLPSLQLGDSSAVREGRSVHFTGFPIGAVLGAHPATHRAIVSAITPIAIPQGRAADLNAPTLRRLTMGTFPVFQLDGTAYPGNSGSPVFDARGSVVGVINMVLVKATKESMLAQPSGIAYAVPAEHLRALLATVQ